MQLTNEEIVQLMVHNKIYRDDCERKLRKARRNREKYTEDAFNEYCDYYKLQKKVAVMIFKKLEVQSELLRGLK